MTHSVFYSLEFTVVKTLSIISIILIVLSLFVSLSHVVRRTLCKQEELEELEKFNRSQGETNNDKDAIERKETLVVS